MRYWVGETGGGRGGGSGQHQSTRRHVEGSWLHPARPDLSRGSEESIFKSDTRVIIKC